MSNEVIRYYPKTEEELVDKIKELSKLQCTVVMRPAAEGYELELHPMDWGLDAKDPTENIMRILEEILEPVKLSTPYRLGTPAVMLYQEIKRYLPMDISNTKLKGILTSRGYEILPGIPIYGDYTSKTAVLRGYKLKTMVPRDEWKHA